MGTKVHGTPLTISPFAPATGAPFSSHPSATERKHICRFPNRVSTPRSRLEDSTPVAAALSWLILKKKLVCLSELACVCPQVERNKDGESVIFSTIIMKPCEFHVINNIINRNIRYRAILLNDAQSMHAFVVFINDCNDLYSLISTSFCFASILSRVLITSSNSEILTN